MVNWQIGSVLSFSFVDNDYETRIYWYDSDSYSTSLTFIHDNFTAAKAFPALTVRGSPNTYRRCILMCMLDILNH